MTINVIKLSGTLYEQICQLERVKGEKAQKSYLLTAVQSSIQSTKKTLNLKNKEVYICQSKSLHYQATLMQTIVC